MTKSNLKASTIKTIALLKMGSGADGCREEIFGNTCLDNRNPRVKKAMAMNCKMARQVNRMRYNLCEYLNLFILVLYILFSSLDVERMDSFISFSSMCGGCVVLTCLYSRKFETYE